ncbi:MAG: trigger factor [Firmicutes bacterium]|nr:trigger factor [Bacillota bacterium]
MDVSVERLAGNQVEMTITVSPADVDSAVQKAVKALARRVNVPGFRKGKVPRRVLELRLGKDAILAEALEELIPDAYQRAVEDSGVHVIDRPVVDDLPELVEGSPYVFKAKVEVLPEVKLGDYRAVRVQKEGVDVSDADVDRVIEGIRDRLSELVSVDKPALENGDFADIDFDGTIDGESREGLSHKGATLQIGSGTFIPGFEEQLIGMSVGEEREVSVTFPEDYHNEDLAGKQAVFKVKLNDIKEKRLPALDDELAKDAGNYENLDQLRAAVRERLEKEAEARIESEFESKVISEVVDRCDVEIPKVLVDRAVESMVERLKGQLRYRGIDMEQYLQYRQMTDQQLRDEFVPDAQKQVKTDLVLDAVSEAEGIEVTDEDVDARLAELARQFARQPEEMRALYEKENRVDSLRDSLRVEKTIAKLKEYASMRVVLS